MRQYDNGISQTDIIVNENLGRISEENLRTQNKKVRIVPQSKLSSVYQIQNVIFWGSDLNNDMRAESKGENS